jgi:hypothetical protein
MIVGLPRQRRWSQSAREPGTFGRVRSGDLRAKYYEAFGSH